MADAETIPCPSCGKPNPSGAKVCRFCTASLVERVSLKWFFVAGILVLLLIAAAHFHSAVTYEPTYTEIHDLTLERNFDRVRVLGRVENISVTRGPYDDKKVRIDISPTNTPDRSYKHRITVRLEGEPADDFLNQKNPVTRGDLIEVAASLFAGEGYRHLSVSGAQFIKVREKGKPEALPSDDLPKTTVSALLGAPKTFENKTVLIPDAVVLGVSPNWPSFTIADPGSTNQSLVVFGFEPRELRPSMKVSVRGRFEFYSKNGYWEIKTRRDDQKAVLVHKEKTSE
ncbi:MAG: zinc ribbon domain-containing protein [Lentisphaerota bacterium]